MKRICFVIMMTAILLSVILPIISLWPGSLFELFWWIILAGIIWIPLLIMAGIILIVLLIRLYIKSPKAVINPIIYMAISLIAMLATILFIRFHVPLRVAFYITQSSFENYISREKETNLTSNPITRIGIWYVDMIEIDRRGGYYFRIGNNSYGPDIISYGFVHKPNNEGSPFGNAEYNLSRFNKEWYFFSVSNDR
jgi:hypothetical protein